MRIQGVNWKRAHQVVNPMRSKKPRSSVWIPKFILNLSVNVPIYKEPLLIIWDGWNLYESSIYFLLARRFLFASLICPWSSPRDHSWIFSPCLSGCGYSRQDVQDAIQKFMYHDDVRPNGQMGGGVMAVVKKKQVFVEFWQPFMTSYSLKVTRDLA